MLANGDRLARSTSRALCQVLITSFTETNETIGASRQRRPSLVPVVIIGSDYGRRPGARTLTGR